MTSLCPYRINKCVYNTENLPPQLRSNEPDGEQTEIRKSKVSIYLMREFLGDSLNFFR